MIATATRSIALAGAILVLGAVNYSIAAKERVIARGEIAFLELAPVDPRSLMQGDYMALRFRLADGIDPADRHRRRINLRLDERRVATLSASDEPGALQMRYRVRNGQVWLGTNAYFFEEGSAARFAPARYGEFRVDGKSGEAVLVGLRDEQLRRL
ncbi:MAG TPA: GDYXXLXY domain-containing protein [Steroidobacteraceae bacterium]|nr:GDYXXLXY domain-containing protein [Steroidobacteraceae bacterium]